MKRYAVPFVMAALMILPAAAALAGVGNGTLEAPPGLLNAKEKLQAAITRQIDKENERFADKSARIQDDLDMAILLGDLELQAKLEAKLQKTTDKHNRKLTKLQDKLTNKMEKFDVKVAMWQQKHGIVVTTEPEPGEEPAP